MIRIPSRRLRISFALAGMMLAVASAPPAWGAKKTVNLPVTLTIDLDDSQAPCAGTWQVGGTATVPVLTCVTTGTPPPPPEPSAPTCTITPPANQTIGSGTSASLTLGNCTAGATLTWHQGSPQGSQVGAGATFSTPQLTSSTTYYGKVTANSLSTSYPAAVNVTPPVNNSLCSGYTVVDLGQIDFDGGTVFSTGMSGNRVAVGTIVVPAGSAWVGKTTTINAFEYGNGTVWKTMTLSKQRCDFNAPWPAMASNTGPYLTISIGTQGSNAVNMMPGETWYVNIANIATTHFAFAPPQATCGASQNCDFALRLYTPN